MHYVYILQSKKKNDWLYVGRTRDLKRRFKDHDNGHIRSTKLFAPFKLIYYEAYLNRKDASDREYKLKHHGSVIGHLKKRLRNSITEP
ncbi:MAG: GIY-YIG nuclease family protein [Candidatus Omnitrophota bacterium]